MAVKCYEHCKPLLLVLYVHILKKYKRYLFLDKTMELKGKSSTMMTWKRLDTAYSEKEIYLLTFDRYWNAFLAPSVS